MEGEKIRSSVLILEDDPLLARALASYMNPHARCRTAASLVQANLELRDADRIDGFIVDVRLKDGSGLDFLRSARGTHRLTPAIVFSGVIDPKIVNQCLALGATFLCKPFDVHELAPFLTRLMTSNADERCANILELASARWSLSPREKQILRAKLVGVPTETFLSEYDIQRTTYKTYVRNLLVKAGYASLAEMVIGLLRDGGSRR